MKTDANKSIKGAQPEQDDGFWNAIRWLAIVPVAWLEWFLCISLAIYLEEEYDMFYLHTYNLSNVSQQAVVHFDMTLGFFIPWIIIFFTTRLLAPKYKNLISIIVVLCGMITNGALTLYGLRHLAG